MIGFVSIGQRVGWFAEGGFEELVKSYTKNTIQQNHLLLLYFAFPMPGFGVFFPGDIESHFDLLLISLVSYLQTLGRLF